MQHPHICSCSLIDSFHSPLVISQAHGVPSEECTMCVYIQVNTEITICRTEQTAQARPGCSGNRAEKKNMKMKNKIEKKNKK